MVFICLVFSTVNSSAQVSMKSLTEGKVKLIFFGYDFTQARFIGSAGFTDAKGVRDYFMAEWNKLIFMEPKKYSLQIPLKLEPAIYVSNTDMLMDLNKAIDMKGRIIDVEYSITEEQARKAIEQYKPETKDGMGCSFVIERFDKPEEKVVAWVVFFDLSNMQIVNIEKMEGKVGGIGLKNYYAAGLAKITAKLGDKVKTWKGSGK